MPDNIKKNILVIVIDCLRSDAIFNENTDAKIPNISTLAKEGVSFPNTIASTSTTCPSFASLLTGCYSLKHGIKTLTGYKLNPDLHPLVKFLKDNGYYTWAELTGPFIRQDLGFKKYFDEYNTRSKDQIMHTIWWEELLTRIKSYNKDAPWFLLLHIWSLHAPYPIPTQFNTKEYGKTKYHRSLSAIDFKLKELIDLTKKNTAIILTADHGEQIANGKIDKILKTPINFVLSKVYSKFCKIRLLRNFALPLQRIFSLGHGYHIYDHLIKIPLIIFGADIPHSIKITKQVRQIDILPTILNLIGIKAPSQIDGKSLLSVIKNNEEPDRPAFIEACGIVLPDKNMRREGIRTPEYKLIRGSFSDEIKPELYNLKKDPKEKRNIYNQEKEIATKLGRMIDEIKSKSQEAFAGEKMNEQEVKKIKEQLKSLGYF